MARRVNGEGTRGKTFSELTAQFEALAKALEANTRTQKEETRERKSSSKASGGRGSGGGGVGNRSRLIPGYGAWGEALGPVRRGNQDARRSTMFGRGMGAIMNRMGFEVGGARLITGFRAGGIAGAASAMAVGAGLRGLDAMAKSSSPYMTKEDREIAFWDTISGAIPGGSSLRTLYKNTNGMQVAQDVRSNVQSSTSSMASQMLSIGAMPDKAALNKFAGMSAAFEERRAYLDTRVIPDLSKVKTAGKTFEIIADKEREIKEKRVKADRISRQGFGYNENVKNANLESVKKLRETADTLERELGELFKSKFGTDYSDDGR